MADYSNDRQFLLKKRSKDKKKGIRDAWTYGASIVVIYVALGLAITLILVPVRSMLYRRMLSLNILFFLMLLVFAASFLERLRLGSRRSGEMR